MMPGRGDITSISIGQRRLSRATKLAIEAAGGLKVCEEETGKSDSHLSRCCQPLQRDSLNIIDAVTIDGLAGNEEGAPYIINAMARQLDGTFVRWPMATGVDGTAPTRADLMRAMAVLTREHGDAVACVLDTMEDGPTAERLERAEDELSQLADAVMIGLAIVRAKRGALG